MDGMTFFLYGRYFLCAMGCGREKNDNSIGLCGLKIQLKHAYQVRNIKEHEDQNKKVTTLLFTPSLAIWVQTMRSQKWLWRLRIAQFMFARDEKLGNRSRGSIPPHPLLFSFFLRLRKRPIDREYFFYLFRNQSLWDRIWNGKEWKRNSPLQYEKWIFFPFHIKTHINLNAKIIKKIPLIDWPFPKLRKKRKKKKKRGALWNRTAGSVNPLFYSTQTRTVQCAIFTVTSVTASFALNSQRKA